MLEIDVKNPVGEVTARVYTQYDEDGWSMVWGGMQKGKMTFANKTPCDSRERAEALAHGQAKSLENHMARKSMSILDTSVQGMVDWAKFTTTVTEDTVLVKMAQVGTNKAFEDVYMISLELTLPLARFVSLRDQLVNTPPKPGMAGAYSGRTLAYVNDFSVYATYGPGGPPRPGASPFSGAGRAKVILGATDIVFLDAGVNPPDHQLMLLFRQDIFPQFVSVLFDTSVPGVSPE